MPEYNIAHIDASGNRIGALTTFTSLKYTMRLNQFGVAVIQLPASFDISTISDYDRLRIYRDAEIMGNTDWFVVQYGYEESGGVETIVLVAYSASWLIFGPIARYHDEDAKSSESGTADDVMKQIIRENMGASSSPSSRVVSSSVFSVAGDTTASPNSVNKSYANRRVSDVIIEIAEGNSVYFDIILNAGKLEFTTWIDIRGQDKSTEMYFAKNLGNLRDPKIIYDYSKELTAIYAGGTGSGATQVVKSATSARNTEVWARVREDWIDAGDISDPNQIQSEADTGLGASDPEIQISGKLLDTVVTRFGPTGWQFGDRVTVQHKGLTFTPIIDKLSVTYENHNEDIQSFISGDI